MSLRLVWESHVVFYAVLSFMRERGGEVAPTGVRCIHVEEETPAACDRPQTSRLWSLKENTRKKREELSQTCDQQYKKLMQ